MRLRLAMHTNDKKELLRKLSNLKAAVIAVEGSLAKQDEEHQQERFDRILAHLNGEMIKSKGLIENLLEGLSLSIALAAPASIESLRSDADAWEQSAQHLAARGDVADAETALALVRQAREKIKKLEMVMDRRATIRIVK
jgi:hypothetical protein